MLNLGFGLAILALQLLNLARLVHRVQHLLLAVLQRSILNLQILLVICALLIEIK